MIIVPVAFLPPVGVAGVGGGTIVRRAAFWAVSTWEAAPKTDGRKSGAGNSAER